MKLPKDNYITFGRKNPMVFRKPDSTSIPGLYKIARKYGDSIREEIVTLDATDLRNMFNLTYENASKLSKWAKERVQ
jgi:hypothetical protein